MGLTPVVSEVERVLSLGASQVAVVPMVPIFEGFNIETSAQGPREAYEAAVVKSRQLLPRDKVGQDKIRKISPGESRRSTGGVQRLLPPQGVHGTSGAGEGAGIGYWIGVVLER